MLANKLCFAITVFGLLSLSSSSVIYGSALGPLQSEIYEKTDFTQKLESINFPVMRINIGQSDQTPVVCQGKISVPDVQKMSTYQTDDTKSLSQTILIGNYFYLIYNDLSIDVLSSTWHTDTTTFRLEKVISISSPSNSSQVFNNVHALFFKENSLLQIWTSTNIFSFLVDIATGTLAFKSNVNLDITAGTENWLLYQLQRDILYVLYKSSTDRISALNLASDATTQAGPQIILPLENSSSIITDFFLAGKYLYICEKDRGLHIYVADQNYTWNFYTFLDEPNILKVIGKDAVLLIVKQVKKPHYSEFEIVEYNWEQATSDEPAKINQRLFTGEYSGILDLDNTKAYFLKDNILFSWYHSIPSSMQTEQNRLVKAFALYGENKLVINTSGLSTTYLYTQSKDTINYYKIADKYPEIFCSVNSLEAIQTSELNYNLEFIGATCPLKIANNDSSTESICLYHQKYKIKLSSQSFGGTNWGLIISIGLGFSVLIALITGVPYYLLKFQSDILKTKQVNHSSEQYKVKESLRAVENFHPIEDDQESTKRRHRPSQQNEHDMDNTSRILIFQDETARSIHQEKPAVDNILMEVE